MHSLMGCTNRRLSARSLLRRCGGAWKSGAPLGHDPQPPMFSTTTHSIQMLDDLSRAALDAISGAHEVA